MTKLKASQGDLVAHISGGRPGRNDRKLVAPPQELAERLHKNLLDNRSRLDFFLQWRVLSEETIRQFMIGYDFERKRGFSFPYFERGRLVSIKYKSFTPGTGEKFIQKWVERDREGNQIPNLETKSTFYNVDKLRGNDRVIVVEGEEDCMVLTMHGIPNVVSLPNGCKGLSGQFLDTIEPFNDIIICLDNDQPGLDGAMALVDKLGKARCRVATLPDGILYPPGPWGPAGEAKDISDFQRAGEICIVLNCIEDAPAFRHEKISHISDYIEPLREEFLNGTRSRGISTGFPSLDSLIGGRRPGELTVISGNTGCHAAGEKILMFDGTTKNVEDLVRGDKLMGPDLTYRRIYETHTGWGELVEIIPSNGESFIVNSLHLLTVWRLDWKEKGGGSIVDIPVHEIMQRWKSYSKMYRLIRTPENFTGGYEYLEFSFKPAGTGPFYGFSLTGSERRFLLGNRIATHNSGKSAFSLNLTMNVTSNGEGLLLGSFEQPISAVMRKLTQMITGRWFHLREDATGVSMTTEDLDKACKVIGELPLYVVNVFGQMDIAEYVDCISYAKRRLNCQTNILDHLHFMLRSHRADTERLELDSAMLSLKQTTIDHQLISYVVVHPAKKRGEENQVVSIEDFRGSSFISQVADNVLVVWRDRNLKSIDPVQGRAQIHSLKCRSECGSEGVVEMGFSYVSQRFVDKLGIENMNIEPTSFFEPEEAFIMDSQ